MNHPLALPGWLEFCRRAWGVTAEQVRYTPEAAELPALDCVLYSNARGQLVLPPYNPFLPLELTPTEQQAPHRLAAQWLAVTHIAAADWGRRGLHNRLMLNPESVDIRAWHWAGFRSSVRYTYVLDLPYDLELADTNTKRNIKKAEKDGFACEVTEDLDAVAACLADSAARQRFSHDMPAATLRLLRECLPAESFRFYLCRAKDGTPASARGILHAPGQAALDLLVGNMTALLNSGASKLLQLYVLQDLHAAGASAFDLEGANLRDVAASKMKWGARLVPFYSLELHDLRSLARFCRSWWRSRKQA